MLACLLLGCQGSMGIDPTAGVAEPEPAVAGQYELNLAERSVRRTVGPEITAPQTRRFVQVEIADVYNPRMIPISFEVHYRSEAGRQSYLGTFSLFPPDNPGTFLVPTRGELRAGGTVTVSLVPLQKADPGDELRVKVQRISFLRAMPEDDA